MNELEWVESQRKNSSTGVRTNRERPRKKAANTYLNSQEFAIYKIRSSKFGSGGLSSPDSWAWARSVAPRTEDVLENLILTQNDFIKHSHHLQSNLLESHFLNQGAINHIFHSPAAIEQIRASDILSGQPEKLYIFSQPLSHHQNNKVSSGLTVDASVIGIGSTAIGTGLLVTQMITHAQLAHPMISLILVIFGLTFTLMDFVSSRN